MLGLFRDLYRYRELIWVLALKELKVRYKRSVLGFLWALLHPLMMMAVLSVVFSYVFRFNVEHYPIFLICTMFPWVFFSQSMAYAVESIVSNGSLLKKIYVPKVVFPAAAVLANLINFLLSLIPLALLLLAFRFPFYATWSFLPVPLLALILFTLGCGFFFATLNVFMHDVHHIVTILLQAWFYLSPVLWDFTIVDPKFHMIFRWNPMLYILNGFRLSIYHGQLPSAASIFMSLASGVVALILGYAIFRRYQKLFPLYV
ncbi:MAG: ABC transporter permease [Terriglobia bacterium]